MTEEVKEIEEEEDFDIKYYFKCFDFIIKKKVNMIC